MVFQQPWLSWVAMLEVLILGWGLQWFYEVQQLKGPAVHILRGLRFMVSLLPALLLLSSLFAMSYMVLSNTWLVWFDVLLVIVLLLVARFVFGKYDTFGSIVQSIILEETLSIASAVLWLYSISIFTFDWMLVTSVIPFLALLYRGIGKQLLITEVFAWVCLGLLGVAIGRGYIASGSMHFGEQNLVTQVALGTLLFSAWMAQWIYERSRRSGKLLQLSQVTRVLAYLVIPLLFLPTTWRLAPELLPVALWCSVFICAVMHRYLRIVPLLIELRVLFALACVTVVVISLEALTGGSQIPALLAVVVSVGILLLFHFAEKTLDGLSDSYYRHMFWASVHYLAFCWGVVVFAITHMPGIVVLALGIYYAGMVYTNVLRQLTKPSLLASYILACLMFAEGPLMIFFDVWTSEWFGLFSVVGVICLGFMIHTRVDFNRMLRMKLSGEVVQFILFHCVVAICYLGIANALFEDWSVATTIGLLLHAVVVLFMTLNPRYKVLLRVSLVLYAATAIKLLWIDLNDFGTLVRVSALMAIGVILMVAAFYYQKIIARVLAGDMSGIQDGGRPAGSV